MAGRYPAQRETPAVKPHPLQRAWAGGVFDARGSIVKTGYTIRIDAVRGDMIERFHQIVQLGTVKLYKKEKMIQTIHIWQTWSADDTREVLLWLSPFFTAQRLKEAAEMIDRIERSPNWQKRNPEKATSSITGRAGNAEAQTPPPNTTVDG